MFDSHNDVIIIVGVIEITRMVYWVVFQGQYMMLGA